MSGAWTCSFDLDPTLDAATYNIPCEKTGERRSSPIMLNVYPSALFIVMAKQGRKGNCNLRNWNGRSLSDGISGILGINARFPAAGPSIRITSITFGLIR